MSIFSFNYGRFQARCRDWVVRCIGREHADDIPVRIHRFTEECLELGQALGGTRSDAHQLVDYVYDRSVGQPGQEVGGVMSTLATLCAAAGLNMEDEGLRELNRVNRPDVMAKVRKKHFAKPVFSALPETVSTDLLEVLERGLRLGRLWMDTVGEKELEPSEIMEFDRDYDAVEEALARVVETRTRKAA